VLEEKSLEVLGLRETQNFGGLECILEDFGLGSILGVQTKVLCLCSSSSYSCPTLNVNCGFTKSL
jgi:hypothetical protein